MLHKFIIKIPATINVSKTRSRKQMLQVCVCVLALRVYQAHLKILTNA